MLTLQLGLEWFPERAGGVPRYYYDLCRFAPDDMRIRGLVLGSEKAGVETGGMIEAFASPSASLASRALGARRSISRLLKTEKIDIVASHFSLFTLPALDLIRKPIVVHFHGPWADEGNAEGSGGLRHKAKYMVESMVYRRAERVIVLSHAFGRHLNKNYGIAWDRIRVVQGGVDVERFALSATREEARDLLGWPRDRRILLSVRRLVRRMGLDVLIAAMAEVARQQPDVLLLIAGKGPMEQALREQIERAGLQKHIRLLGHVSDADLPVAYRAADLSVVPTQALEGFGLIVLESLAAGTPVAVTPVGGLPEIVAPFAPKLVLPAASSQAIAEGLVELLNDADLPGERQCMDYAARNAWPTITRAIANVYREVL